MDAVYVITEYNSKIFTFLFEDGRLAKACPLCHETIIGNIYTARVANIVKSINSAFLDAGTGDYLYYPIAENEGRNIFIKHGKSDKVCQGDEILVQISKDPIKTKKGEATANINLKGDYVVVDRTGKVGVSNKIRDQKVKDELKKMIEPLLGDYSELGAGVIVRTAAQSVDGEIIKEETIKLLCKLRDIIASSGYKLAKELVYSDSNKYEEIKELIVKDKYNKLEIITDIDKVYDELADEFSDDFRFINDRVRLGSLSEDGEDKVVFKNFHDELTNLSLVYNIKSKLEKGFARTIHLKSGGSIVVEPTEAMTVIDVNTGKAIKGRNTEATFLKINKEAAEMIARILRLRNISGIIMIDFINMKEPESIKELTDYLKGQLFKDDIKTTFVDITALGLVELTRKKQLRPFTLIDFE